MTQTITDPDTGLHRHFKVELDPRLIEVETVGPVPPLTGAAREYLHRALRDVQAAGPVALN